VMVFEGWELHRTEVVQLDYSYPLQSEE
jgi:hypothetical protein